MRGGSSSNDSNKSSNISGCGIAVAAPGYFKKAILECDEEVR